LSFDYVRRSKDYDRRVYVENAKLCGGRRRLLESLKKKIAENEGYYTARLLKSITDDFQ